MLNHIRGRKIHISSDLTPKDREIQKQVSDRAKEQRRNCKHVKSGYQILEIEAVLWRWGDKEN